MIKCNRLDMGSSTETLSIHEVLTVLSFQGDEACLLWLAFALHFNHALAAMVTIGRMHDLKG